MTPLPPPLPPALQDRIGSTRRRRFEVTLRDIRRFAQAIGESGPLRGDPDPAPGRPGRGVVAPPLFCQVMAYDDVEPEALPPDGAPQETDVSLPNARTVGGSSDFSIRRLLRPGDVIDVESTVRDIRIKEGRSGPLVLIRVDTRFTDAQRNEVAHESATYVQRV